MGVPSIVWIGVNLSINLVFTGCVLQERLRDRKKQPVSIQQTGIFYGKGVLRNKKKKELELQNKFRLYQNQAKQGNIEAQMQLGRFYYHGYGVKQNFSKAMNWFFRAASQDHADAQFQLGWMRLYGYGTESNSLGAVRWFYQAATQGHTSAQHQLISLYWRQPKLQSNAGDIWKWLRAAAKAGHFKAKQRLQRVDATNFPEVFSMFFPPSKHSSFYPNSGGQQSQPLHLSHQALSKPSPKNTLENKAGKSEIKKSLDTWALAQQGREDAQYRLGWMYYHGYGVRKNYKKARQWLLLAAEQKHLKAQSKLGWMYYYGHGTSKNLVEAARWFRMAAEQGDAAAQYMLGEMHYYGKGVIQDSQQASHLIQNNMEDQKE